MEVAMVDESTSSEFDSEAFGLFALCAATLSESEFSSVAGNFSLDILLAAATQHASYEVWLTALKAIALRLANPSPVLEILTTYSIVTAYNHQRHDSCGSDQYRSFETQKLFVRLAQTELADEVHSALCSSDNMTSDHPDYNLLVSQVLQHYSHCRDKRSAVRRLRQIANLGVTLDYYHLQTCAIQSLVAFSEFVTLAEMEETLLAFVDYSIKQSIRQTHCPTERKTVELLAELATTPFRAVALKFIMTICQPVKKGHFQLFSFDLLAIANFLSTDVGRKAFDFLQQKNINVERCDRPLYLEKCVGTPLAAEAIDVLYSLLDNLSERIRGETGRNMPFDEEERLKEVLLAEKFVGCEHSVRLLPVLQRICQQYGQKHPKLAWRAVTVMRTLATDDSEVFEPTMQYLESVWSQCNDVVRLEAIRNLSAFADTPLAPRALKLLRSCLTTKSKDEPYVAAMESLKFFRDQPMALQLVAEKTRSLLKIYVVESRHACERAVASFSCSEQKRLLSALDSFGQLASSQPQVMRDTLFSVDWREMYPDAVVEGVIRILADWPEQPITADMVELLMDLAKTMGFDHKAARRVNVAALTALVAWSKYDGPWCQQIYELLIWCYRHGHLSFEAKKMIAENAEIIARQLGWKVAPNQGYECYCHIPDWVKELQFDPPPADESDD
ncbi:MAG: hypothetical protein V1738_02310 [Patescibacteria group bacterium]